MATLSEIQIAVALDYDQSSTAPDTSTDDYARRTLLINRAEKKWKNTIGGRWNNLRKTSTLSISTGSTVLPVDFTPNGLVIPKGGYLLANGANYPIVKFEDLGNYNTSDLACFITGDEVNGYYLNLQPTPTSSFSLAITYYSKYIAQTALGVGALKLTSATDETKCPDSDYLVLETVAQLMKTDGEAQLGIDYEKQANELLQQMIAQNNMGNLGIPSEIPVSNDLNDYAAIGE